MIETSCTPSFFNSRRVIAASAVSRCIRDLAYTMIAPTSFSFLMRAIISRNFGRPSTVIPDFPGSTYSSTTSIPSSSARRWHAFRCAGIEFPSGS
nr:hypothetical protein [Glycomyces terrestris]